MEGITGINDWGMFDDDPDFIVPALYGKGIEYLIGDINAAIAGLVEGGVTSIDVLCAHGSGMPDPKVVERVDRHAKLIIPDGPLDPYIRRAILEIWSRSVKCGPPYGNTRCPYVRLF
jgi:hypothetical protein